eukprot:scaffold154780_cov27-Tisochrysis_lutea.AAC.2
MPAGRRGAKGREGMLPPSATAAAPPTAAISSASPRAAPETPASWSARRRAFRSDRLCAAISPSTVAAASTAAALMETSARDSFVCMTSGPDRRGFADILA